MEKYDNNGKLSKRERRERERERVKLTNTQ